MGLFLVAKKVKNLPTKWEALIRSWGSEDPLEKGMATHSSILAWESHGQRSLGVHGITKSQTRLK